MVLSKLASSASILNLQSLILGRSDRHDRHHVDSQNVYITAEADHEDDEEERQNLLQNAAEIQRRRPRNHRPRHRPHRPSDDHGDDRPQAAPQRASSPASQRASKPDKKPARQSSFTKVWRKLSLPSKRSSSPGADTDTATADGGGRRRGRGAAVVKKEVRIFLEARPHLNHSVACQGACTLHSASSSLEALPETSALVITNDTNTAGRQQQAECPSSEQPFKRATHNRRVVSRLELNYPSPPIAPAIILPVHEPAVSRVAQDALQRLDLAARQTLMFGDEIIYALRAPASQTTHTHSDIDNDNDNNNDNSSSSNSESMVLLSPVPHPNWPVWSNSHLSELAHNLLPRAGGWEMRFKCEAKPWLEFRLETFQEREKFWEWLNEEWDKALPCVPGHDGTTSAAKNKMNGPRSFFFGSKKDSEKEQKHKHKQKRKEHKENQPSTSQTEAGPLEDPPRCQIQHPKPPTKPEVAKQKAAARAAHQEEKASRASEDADLNWVCFSKKKRTMRLDFTVNFVYRAPTQTHLHPRPSQL